MFIDNRYAHEEHRSATKTENGRSTVESHERNRYERQQIATSDDRRHPLARQGRSRTHVGVHFVELQGIHGTLRRRSIRDGDGLRRRPRPQPRGLAPLREGDRHRAHRRPIIRGRSRHHGRRSPFGIGIGTSDGIHRHQHGMSVLYGLRLVGHSDRQLELALAEQAHVDQVLLVLESEGC